MSSTWSAADATANGMTLSNGNMTVNNPTGMVSIRGTNSHTAGKYYWELLYNVTGTNDDIGLASSSFNATGRLGSSNYSCGLTYSGNEISAGFTSNYTTTQSPNSGDVWGVAVDFSTGNIWFAQNNTWIGGSNPSTGSLPMISFVPATVGALFPGWTPHNVNETGTLQCSTSSQKYAPPSGFSAWDVAAVAVQSSAAALMVGV